MPSCLLLVIPFYWLKVVATTTFNKENSVAITYMRRKKLSWSQDKTFNCWKSFAVYLLYHNNYVSAIQKHRLENFHGWLIIHKNHEFYCIWYTLEHWLSCGIQIQLQTNILTTNCKMMYKAKVYNKYCCITYH